MSCSRSRSRSGCWATSASSSPTSSACWPSGEIGVDALLERAEAQLLELRGVRLGEGLVGEIGQRRPTPQRERLAQRRGRGARDRRRPPARAAPESGPGRARTARRAAHSRAGGSPPGHRRAPCACARCRPGCSSPPWRAPRRPTPRPRGALSRRRRWRSAAAPPARERCLRPPSASRRSASSTTSSGPRSRNCIRLPLVPLFVYRPRARCVAHRPHRAVPEQRRHHVLAPFNPHHRSRSRAGRRRAGHALGAATCAAPTRAILRRAGGPAAICARRTRATPPRDAAPPGRLRSSWSGPAAAVRGRWVDWGDAGIGPAARSPSWR